MLDPADHLATRLADEGDPLPVYVAETPTSFAVGWQGRYEIVGPDFVFVDGESGGVTIVSGYPQPPACRRARSLRAALGTA